MAATSASSMEVKRVHKAYSDRGQAAEDLYKGVFCRQPDKIEEVLRVYPEFSEFVDAERSGDFAKVKEELARFPDLCKAFLASRVMIIEQLTGEKDLDVFKVSRDMITKMHVKCPSQAHNGDAHMHYASSHGQLGFLEWLSTKNGNVHILNKKGETPLHLANSSRIACFLLKLGAEVDALDIANLSPFFVAVLSNRFDVAQDLLDAGSKSLNVLFHGATLMHFAARYNKPRAIEFLFACGLDLNASDAFGFTPLDVACERKSSYAIILLKQLGGKERVR